MSEPIDSDLRFAILIDADNVSDKYIKIILEEVANSGIATYKRIYGDWTSQRLTSWKNVLLENSIIPMQQYSYTYGKSSTDSAMIIDAMDILYSGNVDGFAIVSSDSDFTRLAARLRESGMQVIGMGEQKTPQPFISACNSFKYLDLLYAARMAEEVDDDDDADEGLSRAKSRKRTRSRGGKRKDTEVEKPEAETVPEDASADVDSTVPRRRPGDNGGVSVDPDVIADDDDDTEEVPFGEMSKADRRRHLRKIRESINAVCDKFSDDDGWVSLGQLGDQLGKRMPDFDVRNYGFKKLRPFLKSLGAYEFDEPSADNGQRQIYLRVRE
ncbi:NYN domain-containing protein [Collinsella tanakaei]|uniref:NYN domain-containing protein n=1 Tax=Collinsella tanakaei TaxID=626935 RepID=UPI001959EB75|nr:NYN domain-containing protein [Collinsella tanakaei]MBM6777982.1 NYN domain-containing protein [Collinsella tanakaei]